jgi:hypothetical protein
VLPAVVAHILQRAGAVWEPGSRGRLVDRPRIGPLIRAFEAAMAGSERPARPR